MKNVTILALRQTTLAMAGVLLCVAPIQGTGVLAAQPPKVAAALPPAPAALAIPKPAEATDQPYAPQPILQGGIVRTLYPPDSPLLKKERIREAEKYNLSKDVPGRISSIVNIHNPSIEVHYVKVAFFRGTSLRPVPPGASKGKDTRYIDIHEDDQFGELNLIRDYVHLSADQDSQISNPDSGIKNPVAGTRDAGVCSVNHGIPRS
jgi:hypothetical protein